MEVSGQLHVLAALPTGKEPLVPIAEESGCFGGEINPCFCQKLNHDSLVVQPAA
jgi:hypothetical protein